SENFLNVAPVFAHGNGTGSMGCVMIAPPIFLSEDEALAIIKSASADEGLTFNANPPGYVATKNKTETKYPWEWENKYVLGSGSVGLNLYDNKKGVAVTYISMEESEEIFPNGPWASVTDYQPKKLAEMTVEDFSQQKGDIAVGVFYDPGTDWEDEEQKQVLDEYEAGIREIPSNASQDEYAQKYNEIFSEYEAGMKVFLEEQLRAQVRDFIEWLQGQGII
ncbi:MAG: hypothetical protein FWD71_16395, partial [Oscillospiraceae bacterium]|nr:hypothetical protein [Oscillospiraceae bacterium]